MKIINQFPESSSESGLAKKIKKAWILFTLACFSSSIIAGLITLMIPGCHCDEGASCRECGLDSIFEFFIFDGFIGFIISIIILPFIAIIILFAAIFNKHP